MSDAQGTSAPAGAGYAARLWLLITDKYPPFSLK